MNRKIKSETQWIGSEKFFRLTIGNDVILLNNREMQDLTTVLESKSLEIYNIPF